MNERLFSLYDYLASYSVRAVLYRQSNIVRSRKPLKLPITRAGISVGVEEPEMK